MVSTASGASDHGVWGLYRCVLSWRDHRQPCPTSAAGDIADLVKSSFGGLSGLWSGSLRCLWSIFPSRFQWYYRRPYPTSAAGYITAFSRRWPYQPALMSSHETVHTDPYMWGGGVIEACRPLTAAALCGRSDVIRTVFSLPMSSSLVCWIGPTAVRKKVARVPRGRGLNATNIWNYDITFKTRSGHEAIIMVE